MGTSMLPFKRPPAGFRFKYSGMKVNAPPDALPLDKYPMAINVRGYNDDTTRTRPGQVLEATCGNSPIANICAFQPIQTNPALANPPHYLAVDRNGAVWLDNDTPSVAQQSGGLASVPDGTVGASMIAFRPNQSPNPYIYIGSATDYQKFSAPTTAGAFSNQSKVGIMEPQASCGALVQAQFFNQLLSPGNAWSNGGTAGTTASPLRSSDQVVTGFSDSSIPGFNGRWSIQISPNVQYQRGEVVYFPAAGTYHIIEEVLPPLSISMTVAGITYDSGSGGHCFIVPLNVNTTLGQAVAEDAPDSGTNSALQTAIAQLQHGSIIRVGSETCYVYSVTSGPQGQICIETSTTQTHAVGEAIIGLPAIVINNIFSGEFVQGSIIQGDPNTQAFAVTAGVGTLTSGNQGASGNVVARPTAILNGWGPNAHLGLYEGGSNQNRTWGLNGATTLPYSNSQLAFDGNPATASIATQQHSHQYFGCVWGFAAIPPGQTGLALNILSSIPATAGTTAISGRSASIFYTLDGGNSWTMIYDTATAFGPTWNPPIPLPAGQDLSKVQVMAFMDSHDDFEHHIYEINITATPAASNIGATTGAFTGDDYLHFSVKVDSPQNINEIRVQLDVSDGTFQSNYFYASVDQSSFIPATVPTPTATSQAAVQTALQTEAINERSKGTGLTIPQQTVAGANQWTEIWIPISELTRVGGDQTKTLAAITAIQFYVNVSATTNVVFSSLAFVGGYAPDVGDDGAAYQYRVIGRSSVTGAKSNPSPAMRYGVNPRRAGVTVLMPALTDSQVDTWDVFRFGGSVSSYRYVGSIPSTAVTFNDNYADDAVGAGSPLEYDNFEPWPTIDFPVNVTVQSICGPYLIVSGPQNGAQNSNWARFLPGTQIRVANGNAYTLRRRPIYLGTNGTNWLMEVVENAGVFAAGTSIQILEPAVANQPLPYLFGTDDNNVCFGCGDPLRPGYLYFSKPSNLDSAPDSYVIEIVQPTEPLIGGTVLDGTPYVASGKRWWRLYAQLTNPLQRYRPVQEPLPRGLAAPWGVTNDGQQIYWWADDGIYSSGAGSLTDADLYTLFPHEGVPGRAQTYGGRTVPPPDYSRSSTFRLAHSNGFLYADYQDAGGNWNTLTLEVRRGAWTYDTHTPVVTVHYAPPTVPGTSVSPGQQTPALYDVVLMGTVNLLVPGSTLFPQQPGIVKIPARLANQADLSNDLDGPIPCVLATPEFDAGDVRADEQWGDYYVDATPAAVTGIVITPMRNGTQTAPVSTMATATTRTKSPFSLGGALFADFLGFMFAWTDNYAQQTTNTILFIWQPSYIDKPETIIDRFTDWDDVGVRGNKFWQGFIMQADTSNKVKGLAVRDSDSLLVHTFTPSVQHNGESEIAYSFDTPFIAHTARLEPANDAVPWKFFGIRWVVEPTPEFAQTWKTQPATHGGRGYQHIRQVSIQYAAPAPITLQINTYDGQSPLPVTLPATGGKVVKVVFPVSANKGQNFTYNFTSAGAFQIYREQCEVLIGQWNRGQARYQNVPLVGGEAGEQANV